MHGAVTMASGRGEEVNAVLRCQLDLFLHHSINDGVHILRVITVVITTETRRKTPRKNGREESEHDRLPRCQERTALTTSSSVAGLMAAV